MSTYLEGPQPESGLESADRGQGEEELLRCPQWNVWLSLLSFLQGANSTERQQILQLFLVLPGCNSIDILGVSLNFLCFEFGYPSDLVVPKIVLKHVPNSHSKFQMSIELHPSHKCNSVDIQLNRVPECGKSPPLWAAW